jgi:hypothetical protein
MSTDTESTTFADRFPEEAAITRQAFLVAFVMLGIGVGLIAYFNWRRWL